MTEQTINVPFVQFERTNTAGETFQFKVLQDPNPPNAGETYIGYCNDFKSVTAGRPDICVRALVRKHIVGLPRGEVVSFAQLIAKKLSKAQSGPRPKS